MGDESIYTIVPAFPPVIRSSLVKQQGCSLLEGQLPGCPSYVVKLGNGLNGLTFWERQRRRKHMFLGSTDQETGWKAYWAGLRVVEGQPSVKCKPRRICKDGTAGILPVSAACLSPLFCWGNTWGHCFPDNLFVDSTAPCADSIYHPTCHSVFFISFR